MPVQPRPQPPLDPGEVRHPLLDEPQNAFDVVVPHRQMAAGDELAHRVGIDAEVMREPRPPVVGRVEGAAAFATCLVLASLTTCCTSRSEVAVLITSAGKR